ncbi:MAG: alkaline phosphatase family protein [Bacilli bacterium]
MKRVIQSLIIITTLFGLFACKEDEPEIETPTRQHPSYYEPGVALIEDAHIVYLNWDGFAYYYFDELVKREVDNTMPTLQKLLSEGVSFGNLRTALPSITNPCQNMILSGSTSAVTKNVYRYYNIKTNTVVQQQRENANKTIADVAVEAGMSVASVSHYLLETLLSQGTPNTYYIRPDNSLPSVQARGSEKFSDGFARMEQLTRLLTGETVNTGSRIIENAPLPRFTVLYIDDIDAVGHNENSHYGYQKAVTEEQRIDNVIALLKDLDQKLNALIEACKAQGVYDKLTFFLTTDHGMTPFGLLSADDSSDYGTSKVGELKAFLKRFESSYEFEFVDPDNQPKVSTTVVGVGANLNLQLTWKKGITDDELARLKSELEKEYYVGKVMTRKELEETGYMSGAADMIISPAERYCFSKQPLAVYMVRAQHDSLLDSANKIFGVIWGKGIKQNYRYEGLAYNYDFGVTMAAALGLVIPNANGIVLDVFNRG